MFIKRNEEVMEWEGSEEEFNLSSLPVKGWAKTDPPAPHVVDYTESNVAALWKAAHDYEYAEISGMAVGLLTIGVLQGKPKSLAVKAWSSSIWQLYYQRKATITGDKLITTALLDFSICGAIPFTVPELMGEVGV